MLQAMSKESLMRISAEELELLKEKVKSLYKNYGIDIDEMSEEELGRVVKQYLFGASDIEKDCVDSFKHFGKFSEDDLI